MDTVLIFYVNHIPEKGTRPKKFIETVLIQALVITIYTQSSTPEGTSPTLGCDVPLCWLSRQPTDQFGHFEAMNKLVTNANTQMFQLHV